MILVLGSVAYDQVLNYSGRFADHIMPDKIHQLNLSLLVNEVRQNFGGTAANTAYSLSLLGQKSAVLATAGKDFGKYKKFLKNSGIETKYIKVFKHLFTSKYMAIVDKSDNQIGGFYLGAMKKADQLSLKNVLPKPKLVVVGPSTPLAMNKICKQCQDLKIPYMYDPGVQIPEISKKQLVDNISNAEVLIGNDYEISHLTKKTGLKKQSILKKVKVLVTTLAQKGSIIEAKNKKIKIKPAKPKNSCDPVGAGDAYRSGFLAGYVNGFDLKTCGQMGSLAAVYTVEKYGTTTHKYGLDEFEKRYYENYVKKIDWH